MTSSVSSEPLVRSTGSTTRSGLRACSPFASPGRKASPKAQRTGLLLARWRLDRNALDGLALLLPDDRVLVELLIKAAAGTDVESEIVALFVRRV